MAEETKTAEAEAKPEFRMQKMYIKDFSFENPNAPQMFITPHKTEPSVDLNLQLNNRKLDDDHWEIVLEITAKVATKEEEPKVLFMLEIEHAAVFLLRNIPEQHMPTVIAVDCPTLLFPFTRQVVSQISVDGGFMPFQMEPINFMALYQNAQKQKAEEKSN